MLKTAEAMIAIVLSLIFVVLIFSQVPTEGMPEADLNVLQELQDDSGFRNCVTIRSITCIDEYLNEYIPRRYNYIFNVTSTPPLRPSCLSESGVFIDSIIMAGNVTSYNPSIVTLYYWKELRPSS